MSRLRRWASPAVAAGALAVLIWRLGTGPFLAGLEAVNGRALAAAAAVVLGTTLCSAWRWTIVARGLGIRLPLRAALTAYYRCLFLNLTLPGGFAGDVHRGVTHGRAVRDIGLGLRAAVWERAAGQAVQAILTIAVLLVLPSPGRSTLPVVAGAAVAAALGVDLVGRVLTPRARSRWTRLRKAVVADVRDGVLRRDALPAVVLASVLVVVGHTATFVIAARTVGVTAPIPRLLPLALLALLGMVLPNIGGWGPREGVTASVFAAAGLGAGRGAAAAVAYGVMVLVASLPGGILLVSGWLSRRHSSRRRTRRHPVLRPEGAADA